MRKLRFFVLVLTLLVGVSSALQASLKPEVFASPDSYSANQLASGIYAYQFGYDNMFGGPQVISIIAIDLNNPDVEIGIGVCVDNKRERISKLAERYDATAAINFGYFSFDPSRSVGVLKKDGKLFSGGGLGRGSGGYFAHDGNQVQLFHESNLDLEAAPNMRAGFPVLVYEGKIYNKIGSYDHVLGKHNRTAIGFTPDNILYFVVVDGRAKGKAIGMTCPELASFMQRLGCSYAMNMDGGGSSAMWTKKYGIISYPSDNKKFDHAGERVVYDIFYVKSKSKEVAAVETQKDAA